MNTDYNIDNIEDNDAEDDDEMLEDDNVLFIGNESFARTKKQFSPFDVDNSLYNIFHNKVNESKMSESRFNERGMLDESKEGDLPMVSESFNCRTSKFQINILASNNNSLIKFQEQKLKKIKLKIGQDSEEIMIIGRDIHDDVSDDPNLLLPSGNI